LLRTGQEELENIGFDFYSLLYARRQEVDNIRLCQESVLDCPFSKLTPEMVRSLKIPVTQKELSEALMAMAGNKSPGPDGVVTEFFKTMWPVIGIGILRNDPGSDSHWHSTEWSNSRNDCVVA
jgi:hypothetical protein